MRGIENVIFLAAIVLIAVTSPASAAFLNVAYTGDNIIGSWYQDGAAPVSQTPGTYAGNWQVADTATLDLPYDHYQFIFEVQNDESHGTGTGNPAGFLDEISGNVEGDLLTSVSWDWAVGGANTGESGFDFDDLTWNAATEYGHNGEAGIIWTNVHGGSIAGISTAAEWIWSDSNVGAGMDQLIYLRGEVNVVPEPSTLGLLAIGLAMVGGLGLSRRYRR